MTTTAPDDLAETAIDVAEPRIELPGERLADRIRPPGFGGGDVADLAGAAVGSFSLTWLIYERLTPLSGGLGFGVVWYVLFVATVWFIARERLGPLHARDRTVGVIVATVGVGM